MNKQRSIRKSIVKIVNEGPIDQDYIVSCLSKRYATKESVVLRQLRELMWDNEIRYDLHWDLVPHSHSSLQPRQDSGIQD